MQLIYELELFSSSGKKELKREYVVSPGLRMKESSRGGMAGDTHFHTWQNNSGLFFMECCLSSLRGL